MKNKFTNDLVLLTEMINDQYSNYEVDPFWKNYEYINLSKIKHFDLSNLFQFTNSYGLVTSKRYSKVGNFFIRCYFGLLVKIKRKLNIDLSFPMFFKFLNFFNFTIEDPNLTRMNYINFILRIINSLPESNKLFKINDDLTYNPIDTFKIANKKYSFNFLLYFYEFITINNFINFEKSNIFLEIGGGYGGFTEIVKKICPKIKIIYIDIVPQLYIGEQYLKSIFSKKVAGYKETKKMKLINENSFSNYDILIVPPWDIKKIQNNLIDNFYNSNSFQEMQKNTVSGYCDELGRIVKNKIVLLQQRGGHGAINDPPTRNDYINYMKSNGFELVEEKLDSYQRQDLHFFQKTI